MKHIEIRDWWLQQEVREGKVELQKIPGLENPADLMTKNNPLRIIEDHCSRIRLKAEDGRAVSASKVSRGVKRIATLE